MVLVELEASLELLDLVPTSLLGFLGTCIQAPSPRVPSVEQPNLSVPLSGVRVAHSVRDIIRWRINSYRCLVSCKMALAFAIVSGRVSCCAWSCCSSSRARR